MATKSDLIRDLRALGIKENDTVLVHSSLSALGFIEGGAETVIEALKEIITEGGNLLFPTLSYATVNLDNLNFDVRNTPCCVGIIPETFRKQPDVIRSIRPHASGRYDGCGEALSFCQCPVQGVLQGWLAQRYSL